MFGRSKKEVQPQKVEYNPRSFSVDPFGTLSYNGSGFVTTPSEPEGKNISLRQRLIGELLPELGQTGDDRASQIGQYSDLFTKRILEKALPMFQGDQYSRGLAGSTAYNRGYMDILNDAIERGLFAGEDLKLRDESSKLSRLSGLESGLQNAFNRLLGIAGEGRAANDQYFRIASENANRIQAADQFNLGAETSNDNARLGAMGDLAGLGSLLAFSKMMGGGGAGGASGGLIDNSSIYGDVMNKTGDGSRGSGLFQYADTNRSFKKNTKSAMSDPQTYAQIAQIAAMFCFVAAEIYGGWDKPKTVAARVFMAVLAPRNLRESYIKHGPRIAETVRQNPVMKEILKPVFDSFAEEGRKYMEVYDARN